MGDYRGFKKDEWFCSTELAPYLVLEQLSDYQLLKKYPAQYSELVGVYVCGRVGGWVEMNAKSN
jgi:hypothetical protein